VLEAAVALDGEGSVERFVVVWAPEVYSVEAMRSALSAKKSPATVAPGAVVAERSHPKRGLPTP
jgi:hypothetical protein